jgi:SNW domain-containing protein 1
VIQYPLDMGKKSTNGGSVNQEKSIAIQLDNKGDVKFDLIARQGVANKNKIIYSKFTDILPKQITEEDHDLCRPDAEKVKETTEKTRRALEALVSAKIAAAMPVHVAEKQAEPQYIRYTPATQGNEFNSGANQRIIKMVEAQVDPMEPPKFKVNKKLPKGPPSPPAPVLHSPTRKVTVQEQQDWKIPPCISNWKNPKGYTIPLDKRLAADGRGLQGVHINENFSKFAESLYIADRKAREAIEMRAKVEQSIAQKEKMKKEEDLKNLANQIREQRTGIKSASNHTGGNHKEDKEAIDREEIRRERQKERQRDRAIQRAAPEKRLVLFFLLKKNYLRLIFLS